MGPQPRHLHSWRSFASSPRYDGSSPKAVLHARNMKRPQELLWIAAGEEMGGWKVSPCVNVCWFTFLKKICVYIYILYNIFICIFISLLTCFLILHVDLCTDLLFFLFYPSLLSRDDPIQIWSYFLNWIQNHNLVTWLLSFSRLDSPINLPTKYLRDQCDGWPVRADPCELKGSVFPDLPHL